MISIRSKFEKDLKAIPASCYSQEYFLSELKRRGELEEFERFKRGSGRPLAVFLQALEYTPQDIEGPFLDVGCGRGEIVICLARLGKRAFGIDYSQAAINISQEVLRFQKKSVRDLANFQLADCTALPFKKNTFQCVFLLDIVEHLTPRQLKLTLREVNRVLKKQGVLIIHTNNRYFEKMAKLFIAASIEGLGIFLRIRKTLREAPSSPYEYLHINYLTGAELRHYLKEIGFRSKIEYVKPGTKAEIRNFIGYSEKWREDIFYNIAWFLLNSPLIKFISPTFWIVARK